jgi:transcriptional activator of cad operon
MNDEHKGERLESWKKIAAYLKRDVRTVQRWEQANGLPIYRQPRTKRPIPFAFTGELDAWWKRGLPPEPPPPSRRLIYIRVAATLLAMVAVFGLTFWLGARSAAPPSVAVLPFVDLSENMANEEFADGVSEELIDRLNRIPRLRVPAPTSTFFYKNKQVSVAEIGKALRVVYVLDGSVRKTGDSVRVAARLIRVRDTAVVWSESYDRRWSNMLTLQDEVAGSIAKAVSENLR